jgi:hypothetical protein
MYYFYYVFQKLNVVSKLQKELERPHTGFSSAKTEVRADKLARRPAFATETHCCSKASRRAFG